MMTHLTKDSFNKLWQTVAGLYSTQNTIQAFMQKAGFSWQKVELLGTGENMVYSLISFAEKENRVREIADAALTDYPGTQALLEILAALDDKSAFLPEISVTGLANPVAGEPVKVFLIYDREDDKITAELKTHLSPLVKFTRSISVFDMHLGVAGGINQKEVDDKELKDAQIVLLLLTPAFIGNDNNDCDRLTFNALQMKKRVIPVLLEPCMWDRISMLESIVPLPRNKTFVKNWKNKDEALLEIANGVDQVAQAIKK
jgi:hypothetical protein